MIRVGLARTVPGYHGLRPPFGPGQAFPELVPLLGQSAAAGPPNPVYAAVRRALLALGLDEAHFGQSRWNPLGPLVAPGGSVVLKPNFIRHWNPSSRGSLESVVTHGSLLRALADYAILAVGPEGRVSVAEAPQMDCNWGDLQQALGLREVEHFFEETLGRRLPMLDLRREATRFQDGIVVERRPLPGDPLGYRVVDLGSRSFFAGSGLEPRRMRGADYDVTVTAEHHRDGRNEYLLSETVLRADLVVNLPKLKTHKKTGVTLALKNLVGINGDKNWLPHHCAGGEATGGDEFPGRRAVDRLRSRASDRARRWLERGHGTGALRLLRRLERATRGDSFIRSGNWHGNRTTWRMCLDLNRCLYYSDAGGLRLDAGEPVRPVLTVLDGVVAGEGEGPLAPDDRPTGVVLAGLDLVAVDLAAIRLMGFDERRIPKVWEAMGDPGPRITAVRDASEVEVVEVTADSLERRKRTVDELGGGPPFLAHSGWRGHLERKAESLPR